jgi:hypothetical protein
MAPWLVEEVLVRAETEVFRLYSAAQARGPKITIRSAIGPGGQSIDVNLKMVHDYVFQFSNHFLPIDETALSNDERQILVTLSQILDRLFQAQVQRRFSWALWEKPVWPEPARPQWTPPPLTPPPSFGLPPLPSP